MVPAEEPWPLELFTHAKSFSENTSIVRSWLVQNVFLDNSFDILLQQIKNAPEWLSINDDTRSSLCLMYAL